MKLKKIVDSNPVTRIKKHRFEKKQSEHFAQIDQIVSEFEQDRAELDAMDRRTRYEAINDNAKKVQAKIKRGVRK